MILQFLFGLVEFVAKFTHIRLLLLIQTLKEYQDFQMKTHFAMDSQHVFFKCGSCENATERGLHSFIGHLNGFSPVCFLNEE
jgi:hypothetical protein